MRDYTDPGHWAWSLAMGGIDTGFKYATRNLCGMGNLLSFTAHLLSETVSADIYLEHLAM